MDPKFLTPQKLQLPKNMVAGERITVISYALPIAAIKKIKEMK
jgi:hypothetical protein